MSTDHEPIIVAFACAAAEWLGLPTPLPQGQFARVFKFENELRDVTEYLGLPFPLPQIDATEEANKPVLTPEQETQVREIYADDIKLWESLQ
jgi:hypothetical protein